MPLHERPENRPHGVMSELGGRFASPDTTSAAEGERGVENNSR
jgi:hypothetical protein